MNGAKKAALLLLSLGREEAAEILKHLDEKSLESVVSEMAKIKSISKEEKAKVLEEFHSTIQYLNLGGLGGKEAAKDLLEKTLGKDKARSILEKLDKKDNEEEFAFLNQVEPATIYNLILNEAPQTIAVILSFLEPSKAAKVLKFFPSELQSKIAYKLANTAKTHPDAIREIAKVIKRKLENRESHEYSEAGGAEVLANILNHMDKGLEESILKELEANNPELADQVKGKLYSFEDLLALDKKEMRLLISRLGDDNIIGIALRGAGDELRTHFFQSMSQAMARDIWESMQERGKVTLREINEARSQILSMARDLEQEGKIILKKKYDEYI